MADLTISTEVYRHTFFGILNKGGTFWTPVIFESEKAAQERLERFFIGQEADLSGFKIVPVKATVTALPACPNTAPPAQQDRNR